MADNLTLAAGQSASNKALVRAYHEALWAAGDRAAIERYWDPQAKVYMTDFEGTAVDVVKADVERYLGAFTEVETQIDHLVAEADTVVLHWTTSGLHVGPYGDIPATHRRITMTGMDLMRVAADRIVECWSMWDGLSVYEQLGALHIGVQEGVS